MTRKGWYEKKKYSKELQRRVAPKHRKARIKGIKKMKGGTFVPTNVSNKEWLYADIDEDDAPNYKDCKPLNPKFQDKKYKRFYKSNPQRTVQNYRELAELKRKEREEKAKKRIEERQRLKLVERAKGSRDNVIRKKGEERRLLKGRDLRGVKRKKGEFPQEDSHTLSMGYTPKKVKETEESPDYVVHTNKRGYVARKNYEKGLKTQFLYLGGERWKVYIKPLPKREYKYEGERDEYGIIPGTAPPKPTKQTTLLKYKPKENIKLERPEVYEQMRERARQKELSAKRPKLGGERTVDPKKLSKAPDIKVKGESLVYKEKPQPIPVVDRKKQLSIEQRNERRAKLKSEAEMMGIDPKRKSNETLINEIRERKIQKFREMNK